MDFLWLISCVDVPLEVFMNFNKMKEMSSGVEDIQRALDSSDILELSSDRQSVRRVTEIRMKEDLDEYMVYVVCKTINCFYYVNLSFDNAVTSC